MRHELYDEMREYLRQSIKGFGLEDPDFDIEAAIWWFAHDYHGGIGSPLYEVLSISQFKPSPLHRSVEDEGEVATMLYDLLVEKYI